MKFVVQVHFVDVGQVNSEHANHVVRADEVVVKQANLNDSRFQVLR